MTDTLTPPTSAPPPTDPPRWRWRPPAVAWRPKLRWFAAEIAVVVAGVLIALALNAWWAARQDAARERVYLTQLATDLAATERLMDERDSLTTERAYYGIERLLVAYGTTPRPPADSVFSWLRRAGYVPSPRPVLGTAEGLVESGNLAVVADDSLRVAVSAYLDASREHLTDQAWAFELANNHLTVLHSRFDLREAQGVGLAALPDSTARAIRTDAPFAFYPEPGWEAPFPLDLDGFFQDSTAYAALSGMARAHMDLAFYREGMRNDARALRQRVEDALYR